MLRKLFKKTLDKLLKYKNDQQYMQLKIQDLESALEIKELVFLKQMEHLQSQILANNQGSFSVV
jgi:predicted acetyltransferase